MHPLLKRQLKRLGLPEDSPPSDPAQWRALLEHIDATYTGADQDRYRLERSLEISSQEMQQLYDDLKRSSQTELAIERDKLHRSLATLHAAREASPNGVVVIDQDRELVDYNNRFTELWEIPAEVARAADARTMRELVISRVAEPERFRARIEALNADQVETSCDELELADGRLLECRSQRVALPTGGSHGRVWFFRDVTSDRHAEQLLREAKEAAEKASGAKSSFLSNMSHEMRTPLNSILGFARILENERFGPLTERQHEYLDYILRAGQHMLNLVNDLLDLRRLEEDRAAIASIRLQLGPVVDEAIQMVRGLADEKLHEVVISFEPGLPDALADRRAVVQILVNLLSNAVKFTPPSGRIAVIARAAPAAILIAVEDTGVGIAAEHHDKLFTYFEQLGAKHASNLKGSGIGLALTRALVEKLGGRIAVHSAPGVGSTFEFSIPRWTEAA